MCVFVIGVIMFCRTDRSCSRLFQCRWGREHIKGVNITREHVQHLQDKIVLLETELERCRSSHSIPSTSQYYTDPGSPESDGTLVKSESDDSDVEQLCAPTQHLHVRPHSRWRDPLGLTLNVDSG